MNNPENLQSDNQPEELEQLEEELTGDELNSLSGGPAVASAVVTQGMYSAIIHPLSRCI